MGIAISLKKYLDQQGVAYEVLTHHYTTSSLAAAQAANVPAGSLAKPVILEDEQGYVMAVLPANCRLELGSLHQLLHRRLGLATEKEVTGLFKDCELGAIPPVGAPYGLQVVVDDSLDSQPDIYFEGGDHRALLHIRHTELEGLLPGARHGQISHRVI
jgi:Ala-tRNA(Pro) deacylase